MNQTPQEIRILVVEDDITNQEVTRRTLEHLGYRSVDVVADGRQALAALAAKDFDLVLMDCHLPVLDGFQTCREIRNRRSSVRNHAVPVVALTAAAMESDRRKCLAAGMNGYLAKPLRLNTLKQEIERWAGRDGPADPAAVASEAAAKTGATAFDWDELTGSVMGSDELARRILRSFLDDMPRQIARLAQAVQNADAPQVILVAHSIKGAAATVGGHEMREVSQELERAGHDGNLTEAAGVMGRLTASFERTKAAMEPFCEPHRGS